MCHNTGIVPRPAHHLVFDYLQFVKTEGEGQIHDHMGDVIDCLDRQKE